MTPSSLRSWRSMVRTLRTSLSPKLLTSSEITRTSHWPSKPTYLVSTASQHRLFFRANRFRRWPSVVCSSLHLVFKELLSRVLHEKKNGGPHIPKIQEKKGNRFSIPDLPGDMEFPTDNKNTRKMKANTVSGGRNKIRKMLEKTRFSILPPKPFR